MKRADVVLILLLSVGSFGCGAKSIDRSRINTIHSRIDEVQRAISQLTRKFEVSTNEVMVLQDQMETTRIQVQKMAHHGPAKKVATKKKERKPFISIKPSAVTAKEKAKQSDAMTLYRRAFSNYEQRKLNRALEEFEDFVKKYPQHDYADNAIYWMGEAYYSQKEYLLAITEFRRVAKTYPTSNKLPDALLKIGFSYERLEDGREAKEILAQVVEQYPYTVAAKKAAKRLVQLGNR
jgi:tol-pal system protein YbgF